MPARVISLLLTAVFGILFHVAVAQSIPKNPNKLEGGQRQGKWTLLFDKAANPPKLLIIGSLNISKASLPEPRATTMPMGVCNGKGSC
jgi:amino acid transporter